MFGERGKLITKTGTIVVDTGTTGRLDAVGDQAVVDCSDLYNLVIVGNCTTPSTTVTLVFEVSYDGTFWSSAGANATIANFATANTAYVLAQSDAHSMPLPIKQARVTITVLTGTGQYSLSVAGYQRMGYG